MTKAVLAIAGMPRRLRAEVESAMVKFLPTPTDIDAYDDDGLCTRWEPSHVRGSIGCRQTLGADAAELARLREFLDQLAAQHNFSVALTS